MTNNLNILEPFTEGYNNKIYASKISKKTNIPQKTASRVLNKLAERRVLKYQRSGKNKEYYFDLTDPKSRNFLLQVEINKSINFLLKYPKIGLLIRDLVKEKIPVLIFGSYAKKYEKKESDIDLLILRKRAKLTEEILKKYPFEIHVQYSAFEEFKRLLQKNTVLTKEILINHIIFNYFEGFMELFENE
ncbi:MAG: nucleotidyltransferase domain-containing protein [Candidatus Woesearchaeota archaeon]